MCTALLATGWLAVPQPAVADVQPAALPGCSQAGPTLRYLVVFDEGTPPQSATSQIAAACGATAVYYPEIAVAVATSPDPSFVRRIGPNRAYSAAAEAYDVDGGPGTTKKPDETTGHDAAVTTTPSTVPTANRTDDQWDMTMIKADEAHKITDGSSRVLVGVLDSGIDPNHPDLAGSLDTADSAGCVTGVPDTNESAWEPTTSAHGTHVAGTIAGADNGEGTTGVAPGVRVASVKVVNDDGYIYPEAAVCGFIACFQTCGLIFVTVPPPGEVTRFTRCGSMIVPLSATAAATSAICSGVTISLSWPKARRPGSIRCGSVNGVRRGEYSPLGATSPEGSSIGGFE